jgi:hypothetical protein
MNDLSRHCSHGAPNRDRSKLRSHTRNINVWARRLMRGSAIRCSTKRVSQLRLTSSKKDRTSASRMKFTFLSVIPTTRASSASCWPRFGRKAIAEPEELFLVNAAVPQRSLSGRSCLPAPPPPKASVARPPSECTSGVMALPGTLLDGPVHADQ